LSGYTSRPSPLSTSAVLYILDPSGVARDDAELCLMMIKRHVDTPASARSLISRNRRPGSSTLERRGRFVGVISRGSAFVSATAHHDCAGRNATGTVAYCRRRLSDRRCRQGKHSRLSPVRRRPVRCGAAGLPGNLSGDLRPMVRTDLIESSGSNTMPISVPRTGPHLFSGEAHQSRPANDLALGMRPRRIGNEGAIEMRRPIARPALPRWPLYLARSTV